MQKKLNIKRALVRVFLVLSCFVFLNIFTLYREPNLVNAQSEAEFSEETLEGVVARIDNEQTLVDAGVSSLYQELTVDVYTGSLSGRSIIVKNGEFVSADNRVYKVGDKLVISYTESGDGNEEFYVLDYVRRDGLYLLFGIFVLLVVAIGRLWGALSLIGMAISFLVIFTFILPRIIAGNDAVMVTILGSFVIAPITFGLSHGIKRKTLVALSGTIITLVVVGTLSALFVELTHLTGFSAEEAGFLQFELGERINMKGILLAGMIIATLGILDDITISQASIVEELKQANAKLKSHELFLRAMRVGRDHISSLVNTLVLVYTGASLPLLLLFVNNPHPFTEIINYEVVADEVVRTLVGSIGLILAVPITTAIAAFYSKKDYLS